MDYSVFKPKIILILVVNLLLVFRESTLAVNSPSNSVSCQISAYVIDTDPRGLNVRQSPGINSSIIGQLSLHTGVHISFGRGDWLFVSSWNSEENHLMEKGWVFASLLGLYTRGYGQKSVPLYEQPTENSNILGQVPSDREVTLLGCSGQWALVKKGNIQGWLEPSQQCPSPVTTCP